MTGRRFLVLSGVAVFVFAGLVFAAVLRWRYSGVASQPERLYDAEVASPPRSRLMGLSGAGVAFSGHDAWIRFSTTEPVRFRNDSELLPCDSAPLREFFSAAAGADRRDAVARCSVPRDARAGRWVLADAASGRYYLRSWSDR